MAERRRHRALPAEPELGAPSWFGGHVLPPAPSSAAVAWSLRQQGDPGGFGRLWRSLMSARLLVALAVLGLQYGALQLSPPGQPGWVFVVILAYLALTAAERLLMQPPAARQPFDAQWLATVGVDLMFIAFLLVRQSGSIHYGPLLALPVLMAAMLCSRTLALGTAVLAVLLLLADAVVGVRAAASVGSTDLVQAGLLAAGLLALAWFTNTLALRLTREQHQVERSRAEARMQALVNNLVIEAMADGVLVVDSGGTVRAANPAAHRLLGSDREVTPSVFSLNDHPAWEPLAELVRRALGEEAIDAAEVTLHHEERHANTLRVRTERTPSMGEGDPQLCVMFLQDQHEMQARLHTEKLAAMGRMSAAVAHEFRNPLAAISQANALLDEELQEPAQRRLTAMVRQNAERLAHIVDDVLDVARMQGQAAGGQAVTLDDEVGLVCDEWAAQHGIQARLQVRLGMPGQRVQFDREHLRRVLVNLLDNALRYASENSGAIEVATQAIRHGPALLLVWSDGVPLEPLVERHMFEPFFSSESRSSGLGLFICRELCERQGASIAHERTVRERAGGLVEGNEFFLHLRRVPSGQTVWGLEELVKT